MVSDISVHGNFVPFLCIWWGKASYIQGHKEKDAHIVLAKKYVIKEEDKLCRSQPWHPLVQPISDQR
jgi:hypothetical protein